MGSLLTVMRFFLGMGGFFLLVGCGKMGNPVSPERLNPKPVDFIEAKADAEQVTLVWRAPEEDEMSRKLKELDFYRIYRREVGADSRKKARSNTDEHDAVEFVQIGAVPDGTIELLNKKRSAAVAEGKPLRKISLSEEEKLVRFNDRDIKQGSVYLYYIVPVNQTRFDGRYRNIIKVLFRGTESLVEVLALADVLDPGDDPFASSLPDNGGGGGIVLGQ